MIIINTATPFEMKLSASIASSSLQQVPSAVCAQVVRVGVWWLEVGWLEVAFWWRGGGVVVAWWWLGGGVVVAWLWFEVGGGVVGIGKVGERLRGGSGVDGWFREMFCSCSS